LSATVKRGNAPCFRLVNRAMTPKAVGHRRSIYIAVGALLCALFVMLLVALIANWALSHNNADVKAQPASAEAPQQCRRTIRR
jgi:hypothetical protein